MTRVRECNIEAQGSIVRVTFDDGTEARFHPVWLRDNALDENTRDGRIGHRLLTSAQIPANSRIAAARIRGECLELDFEPGGKRASWSAAWLLEHVYGRGAEQDTGWLSEGLQAWDDAFDALSSAASFDTLRSDGVLEVAKLFEYVRETNYGRWFEVRTEINPTNLAYTGLGLQAHTDNPHRDPAPTLQILLCLENSAVGGDSVVMDGFAVARRLREFSPDAFKLFSRYCARFAYSGSDGVELCAQTDD